MKSSLGIILLASAAATCAKPCSSKIEWSTCDFPHGPTPFPAECGTLSVPLDYISPNTSTTLDLRLVRVPAVNQPSKGSVVLNFGGPGIAGREHLAYGRGYMMRFGGQFDLISFDPRGTADTIPISCFENEAAKEATILSNPDVWHRVLTSPTAWSDASDVALGHTWAIGKIIADRCFDVHGDIGKYVGTVSTARDIMQIVDALGEDGLLRYWGSSYGTTLGATVAALFPERIDKMLLDAAPNVLEYFYGDHAESISDADKAFSFFFESCLERPSLCGLAQLGLTATELEESVWNLLDTIKYNPIPFGDRLIDYSMLKNGIMLSLYGPSGWPILAAGLAHLLQGNLPEFLEYWGYLLAGYNIDNAKLIGIWCADKAATYDNFGEFRTSVERQYNSSRALGGLYPVIDAICSQWKMRADERLQRDFHVRTRNPVLLIGNTGDPVTSLTSARNLTGHLDNSVLLEHGGYGHASSSHPSACTNQAVMAYFLNGTLPEPGTICAVDKAAFEVGSW